MYEEKNLIYILTILECIEKIWIYTEAFNNASDFIWANDQKELNATISLFIAIGEESKKITVSLKESVNNELNWKDVAGLRDKISHDYRGANGDVLWIIIYKDLPKLKRSLIAMLDKVDVSDMLLKEFISTPHYKHLKYLV